MVKVAVDIKMFTVGYKHGLLSNRKVGFHSCSKQIVCATLLWVKIYSCQKILTDERRELGVGGSGGGSWWGCGSRRRRQGEGKEKGSLGVE